MSLLNCRRKTSVHFSFWKLVLDLCLLCVVLFPRISRCAVTYDICRDDETQAFLACQPPQADVVWYQTFNLTVSPETATCGNPPSTYRQLIDRTGTVQTCDASSPSLQHPPSFMVDESSSTWWQSINLPVNSKELQINITLTFNKTFLMAGDIVVTFNSGRPEQMVLEKSTDYGLTWKPLQYYARNCSVFSSVQAATVSVDNPTAVTCTNRFVEVVTRPPVGQKLKFQVDDRINLFLGPNGANFQAFYSALENKMLDFLKFTDLRLRLIQPFTDNRGNNDMYYYGIADFRVFTWCDCNLHAAFCNYTDTGIVCDCQHHTTGKDCELCLPLYNDGPWRRGSYLPFDAGTANECTKCECNEHATSCAYNATYGRGVCESCQHNTRGYHCQLCVDTFYPNVSLPLSDINICIDCDCDPLGVFNNSHTCAQVDNPPVLVGQCPCRALVSGRRCDQCVPGYYGLKDGPSPGNCTACNCSSDGTLGQSNVCQQSGGQCPCKPNIIGRACDTCADGFYSFPTGRPDRDCLPCDCDEGGSTGVTCDKTSGQCSCKVNITGVKCNQVVAGSFVPMIDILTFEPKSGGGEVTSDLYTPQNPFDGDGFAVCNVSSGNVSLALETVTGGMTQKDVQWPYVAAVRYSTSRSDIAGTLHLQVTGNTTTEAALLTARLGSNVSPACPLPAGSSYHVSLIFTQGQSTASVSRFNNATLDIRCQYSMTLELYHYVTVNTSENSTTNATTNENTTTNVTSGGNNTTNVTTNGTPSSNVTANGNPTSNLTTNGNPSSNVTANGNPLSNATANGNPTSNATANGNPTSNATANGTSNRKRREVVLDSGAPIIIDSVVLLPGLSSTDGSVAFQSYAKSENQSEMQQSYLSCLQQVAALSTRQKALEQSPCKDLFFSLQAELYGARTCDCNPNGTGTTLALCQSLGGQCVCQPGVSGRTCDRCAPGYFNLTNNGCKPCNCHPQGAKNGACNNVTGQCVCYPNVALISDVIINPSTATGPTSTVSNSTGSNSTGFNSTDSNSTNSSNLAVDGTCSVCLPHFYGVSSGAGCTQCGCNQEGSTSLQCDETGQCPCKDSVTGHKCDICKEGYFGFSPAGCSACNCSGSGSTNFSCNLATGACTCKTNVQGDKCMQCRDGFFNLASYNPDGCQPCFCYGHGGSCNSSQMFVAKVLQMTNLTTIIRSGPLLGNHHISYGMNVTVWISAHFLLDLYNETVISFTGNGKTIYHSARNGTIVVPGNSLEYVVPLFEPNWIQLDKLQVPQALDIMGVLANVTEISLISRAKGQVVNVTYIELQSAELRKSASPGSVSSVSEGSVTFVEQCSCNLSHHVAGFSCEKCATGHMRGNLVNISSYDTCTPCNCGGRGATDPPECEEWTGLCLNCRNGTMGEHCEKCAPFVVGDDCGNCSSMYWGLQADGCRACNCSSPGSLSQVCDPQSGSCACASHVTGRTCDQCEENYQSMTSVGCVECDECYTLIKAEIAPLRQINSEVASNVTLLETRNVTATLGPFISRLNSAVQGTEQLVNFLSSVNQSSSQIDARITTLNQSLESVEGQMSNMDNVTASIELGLTSADTLVKQATSHRAKMETAARTIYVDMANLQASVLVLGGQARSLKFVESYLESLANASTSDQQIIAYLATLNQTVARASQLTSEVSQKSQEVSRIHQNSTGNLLLLETMIITVMSKIIGTSSSAHRMAVESTRNMATVKRLQELKTELQSYVVDYVTLARRTQSAQAITSSYQSQVTAEASLFTPWNLKALQSVSILEPFINQTNNLSLTASLLLWRSNNTQQQTLTIQKEAQILLGSVQATLATVLNFSAEVSDMKQRANKSLDNLATLNNQSQTLIAQATNLTDSLAFLKQNVSATRETSQQTLMIIQDKQQKLLNVSNQAEKLKNRLQSTTDTSEERYRAVNNTATIIVAPGKELCARINNSVADLRNKLSVAEATTNEAVLNVSNVTEKANLVLARLKGIQSVNTANIVALVEQVSSARSNVNIESLRAIVSQLQVSKNVQRTEINRLAALKDTLKVRVQSLQLLQGQITPK